MIDLHLHTTASDGLLAPAVLVARAAAAGLSVVSVTDHDTTAGCAEASAAAAGHRLRFIPGIEVTAVERQRDVHILGYFVDPASERLAVFLRAQRSDRVRRVREMAARLRALGCAVDEEAIVAGAGEGNRSVGRPALADALVAGGYASDRSEAFARWLGAGGPAFVPRRGVSGAEVIRVIHDARGVASLAHPVVYGDDELIGALADAGLDALEVWHSDHDEAHRAHYSRLARRLGLAMSGGSDYHGDATHGARLGAVLLPPQELIRLEAIADTRARTRATGPGPGCARPEPHA